MPKKSSKLNDQQAVASALSGKSAQPAVELLPLRAEDLQQAEMVRDGADLIIRLANGEEYRLEGFFNNPSAELPLQGGVTLLSWSEFLSMYPDLMPDTSAGPAEADVAGH